MKRFDDPRWVVWLIWGVLIAVVLVLITGGTVMAVREWKRAERCPQKWIEMRPDANGNLECECDGQTWRPEADGACHVRDMP